MRICHVITRLIIGGAQENTILTCRGLHEQGHDVLLVAGPETGPEGSLWSQAEAYGFRTKVVPPLRRAVRPVQDWRASQALIKLFRQERPDVVHTHSSKAGILARDAARRAGVRVIVHTIHGMSFNRTQPRAVQALYRWLERRAARHTDVLVSVADAMTEQAVAAGVAPRDRFVTVRSGMETERFGPDEVARREVRRAWGVADRDVVVGTVARLFRNKGYEELIEALPLALSDCEDLRFIWVGDGASRKRYEQRLQQLGVRERVEFLGLVRPEEIPRLMNGFDLLVHASRWEGLPRAVVQALLTEVPAVAVDVDGAREIVLPEQTGLLVPPGDTRSLASAVCRLATLPDYRAKLGRHGRTLCLEQFGWRFMVDRLGTLYAGLDKRGQLERGRTC